MSLFRTSTPGKSTKIKFAVSGLALAAAAAGGITVWPASAAAQSAGAGQARPVAPAASLASAVTTHAGRPAAAATNQVAVLDAVLAPASSKPGPTGHRAVHYRRPVRLTPKLIARRMLRSFRWSGWQFRWLNQLWSRESSWNVHASNPYSGAYGIPQAVPGSKMASAGPNWETSARTQVRWGMDYIKGRYGSPYAAWEHELATGWY